MNFLTAFFLYRWENIVRQLLLDILQNGWWTKDFVLLTWLNQKFFQYFDNVRHNSVASYTEIMRVTNHTRLLYTELDWYPPNVTHWICLYALEFGLGILNCTALCLLDHQDSCHAKFLFLVTLLESNVPSCFA